MNETNSLLERRHVRHLSIELFFLNPLYDIRAPPLLGCYHIEPAQFFLCYIFYFCYWVYYFASFVKPWILYLEKSILYWRNQWEHVIQLWKWPEADEGVAEIRLQGKKYTSILYRRWVLDGILPMDIKRPCLIWLWWFLLNLFLWLLKAGIELLMNYFRGLDLFLLIKRLRLISHNFALNIRNCKYTRSLIWAARHTDLLHIVWT